MPYIDKESRKRIKEGAEPETPGELNYIISSLVDQYLVAKGGLRYANINEVIGVLECSKLELYRRVAAQYEDKKKGESGDVYTVLE
jgi:hypothetical protein